MSHAPAENPSEKPSDIVAATTEALKGLSQNVLTRTLAIAEFDRTKLGGLAAQIESKHNVQTPYADLARKHEEELLEVASSNKDA